MSFKSARGTFISLSTSGARRRAEVAETAARPATATAQFADVAITPAELYANPQITQVLLDDAFFDASQWLAESIATEFARAEGAAFVSGDGSNKPLGFLTGTPVTTADGTRAQGTLMYLPSGVRRFPGVESCGLPVRDAV